jgi:hypothetical protein
MNSLGSDIGTNHLAGVITNHDRAIIADANLHAGLRLVDLGKCSNERILAQFAYPHGLS